MWCIFVISAALLVMVQPAKLPSYMSPCRYDAPLQQFSACAEKNANNTIPKLETGDEKYRIPSMYPLVVPKMEIAQGTDQFGLNLTWSPAKLWGLHRAKLSNMVADVKNHRISFNLTVPHFVISGRYKANGRVLVLPITGEGDSNVTVTNLKCHYSVDWLPKKGPDGKNYASVQNPSLKIDEVELITLRFEGLFGGNRLLSTNMLTFLNENWKDLLKEIGPGVADAVGKICTLVVENLAQVVPLKEMFINSPF